MQPTQGSIAYQRNNLLYQSLFFADEIIPTVCGRNDHCILFFQWSGAQYPKHGQRRGGGGGVEDVVSKDEKVSRLWDLEKNVASLLTVYFLLFFNFFNMI